MLTTPEPAYLTTHHYPAFLMAAVALVFAIGQRGDEGVAGELIAVRRPAPIVEARRAAQADTNLCRPSAASRGAPPEARFQKLEAWASRRR